MSEKKQLPKVKFRTNIPIVMTLPFGDAKKVRSRFEDQGDQYMYTVEIDETSHALFATELLHEQLQHVGKGGVAKVVRAEVDGTSGKTYSEFQVEILKQGEPVAQRSAPSGGSQGGQASSAPAAAAPGSRVGAESRLVELAAGYAACVDESKGVWSRSGVSKIDAETIHSTATSFFIALTREGYDLSGFVETYGETEGMKALRKLAERIQREPHLSDVRDYFAEQLAAPPADPQAARTLYVQLREAVKSATEAAADDTSPPARDEEPAEAPAEGPSDEFPPEEDLPESLGGASNIDLPPFQERVVEAAKAAYDKGVADPAFQTFIARITKKDGATVADLSEKQAKAVERSLAAMQQKAIA